MVKGKFQEYFPIKGTSCTYSCLYCRAHLARHEDLISKSFQGSQGRAYLFNQIVNAEYSEAKQRVLLTGVHFVADVYCACCQTMLGWKYERAFEASQRYKEGKVIVELAHLIKDNCWDTEWLSPHHRSPFSASCTLPPVQAQRKPPLVLSARNDSGIFSSPELSISLGLLSSPINREAFSLPFEFSVHLSSSPPPSQPFQSLFGPHPVSVQNSFHPTDPVVTSCHSLYRPPVVPSRVANSTTFPDQPTGSSDVGVCDDRVPNQSPTSPSQIGIKMWSQTDPYCTTTTACDTKSLTLPRAFNRRFPLQPAVYKRRNRNHSFASRRASSSSPSRISLLPLTSEDEDGDNATGVAIVDNSMSNPTTLTRPDRDPNGLASF